MDCLRTSFGRIKSRRSSKDWTYPEVIQMIGIEPLMDCLCTSFGRIRSRRNPRDWTYPKVIQMIETESLMDCLRTSFGRIRSRHSSRDWKTFGQPKWWWRPLIKSARWFQNELIQEKFWKWYEFFLKICGVETLLLHVFLSILWKNIFFSFFK